MRKLLLAATAVALAAPALAQNAPSDQSPSTDPDPRIRNDIKRDPAQSGGGAARTGQGGLLPGEWQQSYAMPGRDVNPQTQGQGTGSAEPDDLPPSRTPDGSTGAPPDEEE
jgi:hypothetical protein